MSIEHFEGLAFESPESEAARLQRCKRAPATDIQFKYCPQSRPLPAKPRRGFWHFHRNNGGNTA